MRKIELDTIPRHIPDAANPGARRAAKANERLHRQERVCVVLMLMMMMMRVDVVVLYYYY